MLFFTKEKTHISGKQLLQEALLKVPTVWVILQYYSVTAG